MGAVGVFVLRDFSSTKNLELIKWTKYSLVFEIFTGYTGDGAEKRTPAPCSEIPLHLRPKHETGLSESARLGENS